MTSGGRRGHAIVAAMVERFGQAQAQASAHEVDLVVARHRVRLRFAGDSLARQIVPALAHLVRTSDPVAAPAPVLTVHIWDTRSTQVDMIPAPWDVSLLGPGGAIPEAVAEGLYATYRLECDMLVVVDARAGSAAPASAILWLHDANRFPRHDRAAPLRSVFAAFFAARGPVVTHAGAVGIGGRGVLLGGRGGSGKSTTTLLCLAAGFDYVGDDYVLVDVDTAPAPIAHSLYATSKLLPPDLARVPTLARAFAERDDSERAPGDKAIAFLHPHLAPQLTPDLALAAVLLPTVPPLGSGRPETRLSPMSPAHALRGLAPSTILQQDVPAQPVLTALARLVQRLPCFQLELGTELAAIPSAIARLLREHAP